jgi:hypothetical protein
LEVGSWKFVERSVTLDAEGAGRVRKTETFDRFPLRNGVVLEVREASRPSRPDGW